MTGGAPPPPIVVMGVQGSGKSTIARLLASRLGVPFLDGDDLHPSDNRARMAAGEPLTDALRAPWLADVAGRLATAPSGIVVACSALKRSYRDRLRRDAPTLLLVALSGDRALIEERVAARRHAFMPAGLLDSQFATLEPPGSDERAVCADVGWPPERIVEHVLAALT